jgi:hypothetical protein
VVTVIGTGTGISGFAGHSVVVQLEARETSAGVASLLVGAHLRAASVGIGTLINITTGLPVFVQQKALLAAAHGTSLCVGTYLTTLGQTQHTLIDIGARFLVLRVEQETLSAVAGEASRGVDTDLVARVGVRRRTLVYIWNNYERCGL